MLQNLVTVRMTMLRLLVVSLATLTAGGVAEAHSRPMHAERVAAERALLGAIVEAHLEEVDRCVGQPDEERCIAEVSSRLLAAFHAGDVIPWGFIIAAILKFKNLPGLDAIVAFIGCLERGNDPQQCLPELESATTGRGFAFFIRAIFESKAHCDACFPALDPFVSCLARGNDPQQCAGALEAPRDQRGRRDDREED
jgi:hypothetical protein